LRTRIIVSLIILITIIGILAQTYRIARITTGAQLLWNANEAYFLAHVKRLGWRGSYLGLARDAVLASWGAATPAQDVRFSVVVIKVTSASSDAQTVDVPLVPLFFSIFEGQIYGAYSLRWTGNQFARVTPDESARFMRANVADVDYTNVNGWSNRSLPVMPLPWVTGPNGRSR
jgi:hypothetical protein